MSIWNSSIETANTVQSIAWIGLIGGATLTLIATMALFWASGVRDRHSEHQIAAARTDYEQLKQQVEPRRITEAQAQTIASAIQRTGLRASIFVTTSDPEAANLRADVEEILRLAGDPKPRWKTSLIPQQFTGMAIQGPDNDRAALINAFAEAGIVVGNAGVFKELQIVIGTKPPL